MEELIDELAELFTEDDYPGNFDELRDLVDSKTLIRLVFFSCGIYLYVPTIKHLRTLLQKYLIVHGARFPDNVLAKRLHISMGFLKNLKKEIQNSPKLLASYRQPLNSQHTHKDLSNLISVYGEER
jgi:hypothetical protein